jgi:heptaprenylglyceryl phosphate synthase
MTTSEITTLLNKPFFVNDKQTSALENVVQEFPYFQPARALYLKGLYNQNSFKYNYALKVTAAHTTDRSVLFDFITSDEFITINEEKKSANETEILEIQVENSVVVAPYKIEKSIKLIVSK